MLEDLNETLTRVMINHVEVIVYAVNTRTAQNVIVQPPNVNCHSSGSGMDDKCLSLQELLLHIYIYIYA